MPNQASKVARGWRSIGANIVKLAQDTDTLEAANGRINVSLKDENALAEYKNQHSGEKYLVNRAKGLGEQDPEELEACLLAPSTRNVQQITVDDAKAANNLFEIFMGTAVVPRREYILAHSEEGEL